MQLNGNASAPNTKQVPSQIINEYDDKLSVTTIRNFHDDAVRPRTKVKRPTLKNHVFVIFQVFIRFFWRLPGNTVFV